MNLDLQIKPFSKRDSTGAITYNVTINAKCYAEGKVILVNDLNGAEVVSDMQLYVPGDTVISELDNVIFNGRESSIKSIGTFFRNGVPDLKVVYL